MFCKRRSNNPSLKRPGQSGCAGVKLRQLPPGLGVFVMLNKTAHGTCVTGANGKQQRESETAAKIPLP